MWVRAVAAALAVWCVSGTAMAAGYAETWNPPEAAGHAAKQSKKKTAANGKAGTGSKSVFKAGSKTPSKTASKAASSHVASGEHGARRVVSASGSGHKPAAHGAVTKVAPRSAGFKGPGASKFTPKTAVMALDKKPHAQLVKAKPGLAEPLRANLVQGGTAHPHAVKVTAKPGAAKPGAVKPAVSPAKVPPQSANVSAIPATPAAANPAAANSGSLPPILH